MHWRTFSASSSPGGQLAVLASLAPVRHADLIVRHEERPRVEQFIDSPGLVAEDRLELGVAQAAHDLESVRDHRVIPAHAEPVAVLDPGAGREPDRRAGMAEFVFAGKGTWPSLGSATGSKSRPSSKVVRAVGGLDRQGAPLRRRTLTSASSSSCEIVDPERPLPSPQNPT